MTALTVLIPLSLGMGLVGLCAFVWALRANQFDDPEGNAWRVITLDDQSGVDDPRDGKEEAMDEHGALPSAHRDAGGGQ